MAVPEAGMKTVEGPNARTGPFTFKGETVPTSETVPLNPLMLPSLIVVEFVEVARTMMLLETEDIVKSDSKTASWPVL